MEEAVAMKWHLSLGAKLMLLFTVLPLVELALLVQLTRVTNLWVTLLMIAVPGILGAMIIKREGLATWRRAMEALAQGKFPADELLSGLVLLLGGALLLTPGVITDLVGLSTLIPAVRRVYTRRLRGFFEKRFRLVTMPGGASSFQFGGLGRAEPAAEPKRKSPFESDSPFDRAKKKEEEE
jgi:UPF0716 protein FxsA